MKNRLIVTFSDNKGTKSYSLHTMMKKILLFGILSILVIIFGSVFFINYLTTELDNVKTSKQEQIAILEAKEKELQIQNKINDMKIKDTLKDFEALSSTLDEIEKIVGIKNEVEKDDLIERAQLAKLNSIEKMYLLDNIPNGSPLKETLITARFGYRIHPITKKKQFHRGIDLRAKRNTPVMSTADGIVRYIQNKNKGGFGKMIIISHNYGFETVYAHLNKTKVKIGDVVKKGDTIGLSGNTGRSTGPHLHYETRYASRVLNPRNFINWSLEKYDLIFEKERKIPWESLVAMISRQMKKPDQQ